MALIDLMINRIPSLLRNDFWTQILEVLAEEIENQREEIDKKSVYYDVDQLDVDTLQRIASKYGYTPNLIIDDSVEFLQKEVKSIAYRIKNKTTLSGYKLPMELLPVRGDVYNIVYNGNALYRAVDYDMIKTQIDFGNFGETIYIPPILYFSTVLSSEVGFDRGFILDEGLWTLDTETTIIVSKHLAIEYAPQGLITKDGEEYLLTNDYYQYLWNGVEYNRKASTVPHVGVTFNASTDLSGAYNNIGDNNYSVPDIKLNAWTTSFFNTKEEIVLADDFYYISFGNSTKGGIDYNNPFIFDNRQVFYSFDEEDSATSIDKGLQGLDLTITGNTTRPEGVIGRALEFDGATYGSASGLLINAAENNMINFWFKPDDVYTSIETLLDLGYLKVTVENTDITFLLTGDTDTYSHVESFFDYVGEDIFFHVELDNSTDTLKIYMNTTEILSVTSGVGSIAGTYDINIGHSATTDILSHGIIDEVSIFNGVLFTTAQIEAFYNRRIGDVSIIGNRLYRRPLEKEEVSSVLASDNTLYIAVQAYANHNHIGDEYLGTGNGTSQEFTAKTRYTNIEPKTVKFHLLDEDNTAITLSDDGAGRIDSDVYSGSVDYDTGDIVLRGSSINQYSNELVELDINGDISDTLEENITPSSMTLYYQYNGILYFANDDGSGNITGTNISSGTIDYILGTLSVTFTNPNDDVPPYISYEATKTTFFPDTIDIKYEYRVKDTLEISEVSIEDKDHNTIAYATFPPIESSTWENHVAPSFLIRIDEIDIVASSLGETLVTSDGLVVVVAR